MSLQGETGIPGGIATETYSFPVVILGGGFAGTYCARALTAGLHDAAESVALVADQNAMLFHPMLAEVSGVVDLVTPRRQSTSSILPEQLHFHGIRG